MVAALSLSLLAACDPSVLGLRGTGPSEANEPANPASEVTLVGSWQSGAETLEFRADGTMLISGAAATYQVVGQTIAVTNSNGNMSFPFDLSAEQLVLTVNGVPVTYQRTSPPPPPPSAAPGNEAVAASSFGAAPQGPAAGPAPGAPAAAPGAAGPPQGSAALLVGKWCYVSNVYANDGGRASDTCFVLNADGTYQYHSETSSSGQYGSSASQSDDSGTWQATDTTLTAHSRSGQTYNYQFQRQNHPKNNDPMLVFDGKAFVTFYQKPPW